MKPDWKHYSSSSRYFDSQHYVVFNEEAAGTNCINILFHHCLRNPI